MWKAIFFVDSIEYDKLVRVICIALIVVLNDRGERTVGIWEGTNTNDHHEATKDHLWVGRAGYVAVAYSGECRACPVHRDDVEAHSVFLVRFNRLDPCIFEALILHSCHNDPKTCDNVHDNDAKQYEEEKALETETDSK